MRSRPVPESCCTSVTGASRRRSGGARRSACQLPETRCGPWRHAEPGAPGHQGSGSKSVSVPLVASSSSRFGPWRALAVSCASALPDRARRSRISMRSSAALASSTSCTGCGAASSRPSSVAFTASASGGGVPPAGEGRPSACSATGPDSAIAAARPCRRCGCTASSTVSSASACPFHVPLPPMRPALPRVSASVASKRWISTRSRALVLPPSSAARRASGRRRSSQRPGSVLSSCTVAVTGASFALVCTSARPAMRVSGSALASDARFSASVRALSAPSHQGANGRISACTSADGAGPPEAGGAPRRATSKRMRPSEPPAFTPAP